MSMTITGKVESKARSGEGIKVGGKWYNGTAAQLANVEFKGDVVFTAEGNKILSVEKETKAPAEKSSDDSRGAVQQAIIYQSSRKDAVAIVCAILDKDFAPLPAAKASKFDAVMALVDTITDRYYSEAVDVQMSGELPARNVEQ